MKRYKQGIYFFSIIGLSSVAIAAPLQNTTVIQPTSVVAANKILTANLLPLKNYSPQLAAGFYLRLQQM